MKTLLRSGLPPLLTVWYDGACALCRAEMDEIRSLDADGDIAFVDCAAPGFDDAARAADGVRRDDLMQALHVRDVLGDWHRGVDAIALLYATVGAPWLARAWAHPLTRPLTRRLYPWLVRHRHRLSALGLHVMASQVLRRFSRRHAARSAQAAPWCRHGDTACDGRAST